MGRQIARRSLLGAMGVALAGPRLAKASKGVSEAERVYRDAIVIDGNLIVSALDDEHRLTADQAAKIKHCGLTALKQTLGGADGDYKSTLDDIGHMDRAIALNKDVFRKVVQIDDIADAKRAGRVGIIYSFEAASMHEGRLERIAEFRRRDVRVMGLSYNRGSPFGSGTLAESAQGLTPLGRQAVAQMNSLGVSVDLSHSDEPTGLDAIAVSIRPVLITHAGCAAVHPHPRNKSDRLLRAVAEKGGVVGIYDLSYLGNYPRNPTLDIYMRHLTHALQVCGEDHVGIGSDTDLLALDTSPESLNAWDQQETERHAKGLAAPEEGPLPYVQGLQDETRWSVIASELMRRGYRSTTVDKVLGLNFRRGFAETW